jgi:endoglucanase
MVISRFGIKHKNAERLTALLVIIVVAAIGTYLLTGSHAATPFAVTSAGSGSLSGAAIKQSDGSVQFGTGTSASPFSIKVLGTNFIDQTGKPVQLRGIDRSGTEYSCTDNHPYKFTTDSGTGAGASLSYASTVASSLLTWNKAGASTNAINAVRVPLNEDCWLGINLSSGSAPFEGANYQQFIQAEVSALTAQHMYVILDLHLTAPGTNIPINQDVAPDEDHAPAFWQQVASQYKNQPSVMFDLFNEPRVNQNISGEAAWTCYELGCTTNGLFGSFQTAGTQQLVSIIRAAGANNVITIGGLQYDDEFDYWVDTAPHDCSGAPSYTTACSANPDPQIAPSLHLYSYSTGNAPTNNGNGNFDNTPLDNAVGAEGLTSKYPLYMGEFGEIGTGSNCTVPANGFTNDAMSWADSHGYSYTAWGWDSGQGCGGPSLVTNNNSGATSPYGELVKEHLQSLEH